MACNNRSVAMDKYDEIILVKVKVKQTEGKANLKGP
jgi:hypothetical protein